MPLDDISFGESIKFEGREPGIWSLKTYSIQTRRAPESVVYIWFKFSCIYAYKSCHEFGISLNQCGH